MLEKAAYTVAAERRASEPWGGQGRAKAGPLPSPQPSQ